VESAKVGKWRGKHAKRWCNHCSLYQRKMTDSSDLEVEKARGGTAASGKRRTHCNMTPIMRDAMLEWLDMDREGQKDGYPMKNWRSIYGGAAKGRNMNDSADDVHAKGGYQRLANFVNQKCKIKSDKSKAWDAELAEKRWHYMKKLYRKAIKTPVPLNTAFDSEETFQTALEDYRDKQEKVCPGFMKLYAMLYTHPSTQPHNPHDSMALDENAQDENNGEAEAPMLSRDNVMGAKRMRDTGGKEPKKQKKEQKKEFHLRKPHTETATSKRMNLHHMFLESQKKQSKIEQQKLMVDAIGKLAKAGILPENMPAYLALMGLTSAVTASPASTPDLGSPLLPARQRLSSSGVSDYSDNDSDSDSNDESLGN
jgi:hypothetical protein